VSRLPQTFDESCCMMPMLPGSASRVGNATGFSDGRSGRAYQPKWHYSGTGEERIRISNGGPNGIRRALDRPSTQESKGRLKAPRPPDSPTFPAPGLVGSGPHLPATCCTRATVSRSHWHMTIE
jgi:hypothetical protein